VPESSPSGELGLTKFSPIKRPVIRTVAEAFHHARTPFSLRSLATVDGRFVRAWQMRNAANFERSLHDQYKFQHGLPMDNRLGAIGHLWLTKLTKYGDVLDFGLVSCRVVTDSGVGFIVDAFQNLVELENMKYHGLGTGTTAEAATQTALVTELTTQYATSSTRPTGSLGEKSGDSKTYETSAAITVSATVAATEHGIFSQAATGGGVMIDRSLFSVVNLASTETLQATYQLTFPSGS
jgi:hypothetical protein